ncbi:MAG: prepilin-type N-terminal cleavage/methylation domain-containing protein [Planctomycetes bacterium]|nr:prepilin-type N-terminal cleavage/methylation domain-containing protein [Planctomycetota bacterium]
MTDDPVSNEVTMTNDPRPAREGGFTLVEVLLAIGITAFVMVTVGSTFSIMLNARDVVDDLAESSEAGPRILNLIERDLRGLWTFNVQGNKVFRGRVADVNGRDADRMDFLTTTDAVGYVLDLDERPLKPSICEVGYWFKPNPRYRDVFEMWRREDPMVDDDLLTQGSFQLVHDRIKSFKVRYFDTLGYEAEERLEWDSSIDDKLPKRIRIEFTIERRRASRNVVSDVEVEDFEGAEKTYVRHFVFDPRLETILQANNARVPVIPPGEPEAGDAGAQNQANGPAGPGGPAGPAGPGGQNAGRGNQVTTITGRDGSTISKGSATTSTGGPGAINPGGPGRGGAGPGASGPGSAQNPIQLPPGFDLRNFFGNGGGSGGLGGLFPGGG